MGFKGIDIRQSGDRLLVRVSLKDSTGAKVTTGSPVYRLFELQSDGTLKSYDFSDNTFKTTAPTTFTQALTHRTGNNGAYDTGIWTHALTTVSGFTRGNVYIVQVTHSSASPESQEREFQFGGVDGDVSNKFCNATEGIVTGVVAGGATTTSIPTASLDPSVVDTDQFKGAIMAFEDDTATAGLRGQRTNITANSNGGTFTVAQLSQAPASGDRFTIE